MESSLHFVPVVELEQPTMQAAPPGWPVSLIKNAGGEPYGWPSSPPRTWPALKLSCHGDWGCSTWEDAGVVPYVMCRTCKVASPLSGLCWVTKLCGFQTLFSKSNFFFISRLGKLPTLSGFRSYPYMEPLGLFGISFLGRSLHKKTCLPHNFILPTIWWLPLKTDQVLKCTWTP